MELPFEIWKEISLLLPYNFLAISKAVQTIYDESWFEKKVKTKYPNCKQHDNSWEFLYKRSLKSGKIFCYCGEFSQDLYVKGIKMSNFNNCYYSLLTFDGDLYTYDIKDNLILMDSNIMALLILRNMNGIDGIKLISKQNFI
jgi:hypothetical protein